MSSQNKVMKIIWIGFVIMFGGLYLLGNVLNLQESLVKAFALIVGVVIAFMCLRHILRDFKHLYDITCR